MILSGRLADWSVPDLLQIMHVTRKTGSLEVQGHERSGTIFFRKGRIVDARLSDTPGLESARERIVEVVYVLQLLADGSFSVGSSEAPDPSEDLEVGAAIELAARHLSAETELRESGLLELGPIRLVAQVDQPVTLPPELWGVVATLAGSFTLELLEAGLGRARAIETVMAFWKLGLVEAAEGGQRPSEDAEVPESWFGEHMPEDAEDLPVEGQTVERVSTYEDDEARMLIETASGTGEYQVLTEEAGVERRKEMRAVISPADTTLVPGVLDDIRQRFRPAGE